MALTLEDQNEEKLYSNFIESLRSEETKLDYAGALKRYMSYHGFTKYSDLMLADRETRIKDYIIYLNKKGTSKSGFILIFSALRNFYAMNDVDDIKWSKLKRFKGEELPEHEDRAYSHNEILTLVENAPDLKTKSAILLMAASGLRVGALPTLKIGHLERRVDLYKVSVYKGLKGKGYYYTFTTPESYKALTAYFRFRERCGERLNNDSPLFRRDFDSNFHEQARNDIQIWNKEAIKASIHRLLVKTGLKTVDRVNPRNNRKEVKQSHGLRKFFVSQLVNAGLHDVIIKKLTGHKAGRDMTQVYSKQTEETMLNQYTRAIDLLTINPENRLKHELDIYKEKQDEIAIMKLEHQKEMKQMRQDMDKILELVQENPKLAKVKKEILSSI